MSWFSSPIESFKAAYQEGVAKWRAALSALDAAYAEFRANEEYARTDEELAVKWNEIDSKVSVLTNTITSVNNAINTIVNFFAGIGQSVGLGAVPVIPWATVALITAGIAGVWSIINQLRQFNLDVANIKIAEQNIRNAEQGLPPIPYIDNRTGGLFTGLPETAKWIAIGVTAYFAFKLLEK